PRLRARPRQEPEPELPRLGQAEVRMEELEPGHLDLGARKREAAAQGCRPELDHLLEQQAGARLQRAGLQLELLRSLPLADAAGPAEGPAEGREEGGPAAGDRLDGRC